MMKLEIGSGFRPTEGFEHLDINPECPHLEYICDMDKIPIEDETFDELKAIHVIEHQPWRQTQDTLKEWCRILKPGGKIRIGTPNLMFVIEKYMKDIINDHRDTSIGWEDDYNKMQPDEQKYLCINGVPDVALWANFKIFSSMAEFDEHKACFDSNLLRNLLRQAGFSKTKIITDFDVLVMEAWK